MTAINNYGRQRKTSSRICKLWLENLAYCGYEGDHLKDKQHGFEILMMQHNSFMARRLKCGSQEKATPL